MVLAERQVVRVVRRFKHEVKATREQVFPLLCPLREGEWIDGWSCELVYSASGVAEDGCVFTTGGTSAERAVWQVTLYEPMSGAISFSIYHAAGVIEKLDVALQGSEEKTELHWTRSYTALHDEGRAYLEESLLAQVDDKMAWIEQSLRHFLGTGEKLLRG